MFETLFWVFFFRICAVYEFKLVRKRFVNAQKPRNILYFIHTFRNSWIISGFPSIAFFLLKSANV